MTDHTVHAAPIDDHASLIQNAIDACTAAGGGRVVLAPGVYPSGSVTLKSGVNLHLLKGATLLGLTDIARYARKEDMPTALLFADGARDIALSGEGTIDGNGRAFRRRRDPIPEWVQVRKTQGTWIPAFETASSARPLALIHFADCRGVRMEDLHITDSPRWTVHLFGSSDITLRHLTIRSTTESSNGDGIDLDGCSDVLLEDCDIESGDDAICLKSSRTWGLERHCRRITIRRCRAMSNTHGFCIGHDTLDDYEDITVSDITMGGWGGYRCLTGIGIGSIDGANIRRLKLSNIRLSHVVAPLQIRLGNEGKIYRGHSPMAAYHQKQPRPHPTGEMRQVTIEDLSVTDASGNSFISGLPGELIHDLTLRNVQVTMSQTVEPAVVLPTVPELRSEYPQNEMWRFMPCWGLFLRHIDGLTLDHVKLTPAAGEFRPAMIVADVANLCAIGSDIR